MTEPDDSFELYDLLVSVVGDPEGFVCKHEPGPAFEVIGEDLIFVNEGHRFSQYTLATLLPLLPAKQRETEANDWMTTDAYIACPDPHCKAQFEIKRLGKTRFSHGEATKVPLR